MVLLLLSRRLTCQGWQHVSGKTAPVFPVRPGRFPPGPLHARGDRTLAISWISDRVENGFVM